MIKLNKKADENTAISSPANKNRQSDSFRLSDKIKVLYRYLSLNKDGKFYVKTAIDAAFNYEFNE